MGINNKILLITERQEQFDFATSLLREVGYRPLVAASVSQGIRMAEAENPHLIISELAGPHIDGLELCRLVRSEPKLRSTPILLVGDLDKDSSIVKDSRRCGASDYVQKPIEQGNLFDQCYRLIASNPRNFVHLRAEPLIYRRPEQLCI